MIRRCSDIAQHTTYVECKPKQIAAQYGGMSKVGEIRQRQEEDETPFLRAWKSPDKEAQ